MANTNSTGSVAKAPKANAIVKSDLALLEEYSRRAWSIHNVLSFMSSAVDDDDADALPIKCTLIDLEQSAFDLATELGDESDEIGVARRTEPMSDQSRSNLLMEFSRRSLFLCHVFSFMIETLGGDRAGELPVCSTLIELRELGTSLASDLSVAADAIVAAERATTTPLKREACHA